MIDKGNCEMKFPVKKSLILGINCFGIHAFAQSNYHGSIGLLSNQFVEGVGDVDGNRRNADVEFNYHKKQPDEIERKFVFSALNNDQNKSMFSLQEAYALKDWNRSKLQVGRQILKWNEVDAIWGFGKLNNRKNFNGFEPGQEGLTGLRFIRKNNNKTNYEVFGSVIYVPEMNPGLNIDKSDGTITSSNPWANPPASSAQIPGQPSETKIFYDVDYPEYDEVVFRYSLGMKIGWSDKHIDANSFVVRKPENQVSATATIDIDPGFTLITAKVKPQFYYHDVYGGNLTYTNKDLKMYASAIAIRPNEYPDGDSEATGYTDIKTEKKREDYVGGGISKENDIYTLAVNYVARLSPFNREGDVLAQDPRWNQAINLHGKLNWLTKWQFMGDIKYDMLTTDRLTMWKVGYLATKNFLINVGVNMIGTPNNGRSYWSPYTNNDMAYVGLRYVF